jgi:hypothetical protein
MRCTECGTETNRFDVCGSCGAKLTGVIPIRPKVPLAGSPPLDVTQPVAPPVLSAELGASPTVPPPLDTTQVIAPQAPRVRISLTGEAIPIDEPAVVPLASAPPGTRQSYATPIAPPRIANPNAGLPASAVGVALAQSVTRDRDAPTLGARWELTLAIFLPIMALSVLLIKMVPASTLWVQFVDYFAVGLALSASSAIASYDDAFMDCVAVLVVCFVIGPAFTLVAYTIVCAVKQEWNAAIILLLLGDCVVALIVAVAMFSSDSLVAVMMAGMGGLLRRFFVCATFAGWMMGNFFRPVNE